MPLLYWLHSFLSKNHCFFPTALFLVQFVFKAGKFYTGEKLVGGRSASRKYLVAVEIWFFRWAVGCHAKWGQRETAAFEREDFVQEHDHAVLHEEPNTGKTKTLLGHGLVWVSSFTCGCYCSGHGRTGSTGPEDCTDARAGVQSQDWAQSGARPYAAPFSIFYFPAKLSPYSHSTLPGTNGICSHTCSELCGNTALGAVVCWRCTLVVSPSPSLISCASSDVPQLWNSPEMVGETSYAAPEESFF